MEFKKFKLWTEEEDKILKQNFHSHPFNRHDNTRFPNLQKLLKEKGFERTIKAITRRTFRIGLTTLTIKEKKILLTCDICNTKYKIPKRYAERNTRNRCKKCQKKNGGYKDKERNKAYQKQYQKTWKKTKS